MKCNLLTDNREYIKNEFILTQKYNYSFSSYSLPSYICMML